MSDSLATRLNNAKQFLLENPTETVACAARIFNLSRTTLTSSVKRGTRRSKGGENRILQEHHTKAVHDFIRSLLAYGIQPTHEVVFAAIRSLKQGEDPDFDGPSERWFQLWWKANKLHKIKTKPLAVVRYSAAQESDVRIWFEEYRQVLRDLKIVHRRNIINFDEAGFRIGCMKGHEILVPADVKEYYAISPENRKSVTIFECINAAGHYPPPPVLVIQGHYIM